MDRGKLNFLDYLFFFRLYRIGGKSKKGGRAHQQNGHKKHRKTVTRVKMSEFHA
jgi:hypothetical protein